MNLCLEKNLANKINALFSLTECRQSHNQHVPSDNRSAEYLTDIRLIIFVLGQNTGGILINQSKSTLPYAGPR